MNKRIRFNHHIEHTILDNASAAEFLGCAASTLKLSRHTGMLFGVKAPEYLKLGARSVRYKQETLEMWLSQFQERSNTSAMEVE